MKNLIIFAILLLSLASCKPDPVNPVAVVDCENDLATLYVGVKNWTNCDSVNYQWNSLQDPAYGVPVQLQFWDSCGSEANGWQWGTQYVSVWLWSDEIKEIKIKKGWCMVWGLEWFPTPCSPVRPDIGQAVEIAIYEDAQGTVKVWPEGSEDLTLWPIWYNGLPSDSLFTNYTGYHEASKIITKVCP